MEEHFSRPEFNDFPISMHLCMIRDDVRMKLFADAINEIVSEGDSVIDIGSGTGILSFFAQRSGASEILGIEISSLAEYANQIAAAELPEADVKFVQQNIFELGSQEKKYDVAICELLGSFGIDENIVPVINHVRENLLKPGGRLLPETLELIVAPVQCTSDYREIASWKPKLHGLDFSPIQELAYNAIYHINGDRVKLLAEERQLCSLDFYSDKKLPENLSVSFEFDCDAVIHGVVGWFRSQLAPGCILDTSPLLQNTHWGQLFFPIGDPLKVHKGGSMEFVFDEQQNNNLCRWTWSGEIKQSLETQENPQYCFHTVRDFG